MNLYDAASLLHVVQDPFAAPGMTDDQSVRRDEIALIDVQDPSAAPQDVKSSEGEA